MLGLKLNDISKRGPWYCWDTQIMNIVYLLRFWQTGIIRSGDDLMPLATKPSPEYMLMY